MSEEKKEMYVEKTIGGVKFIEKEAFDDLMEATEHMVDDLKYYVRRTNGWTGEVRIPMVSGIYNRYEQSIAMWEQFKKAMMGGK